MKRMLYIVTFLLGLSAVADAQTIADIARQERARRQTVKGSATTLTNDTIKTMQPTMTGTPQPAKPAAEAPKEAPPAAGPARDETYWRKAFKDARDDIKRAEDQVTILQLDLNRANRDYLQRSDVYNRELRIGAEINDINARLEAAKKTLEAARQKLALLEEEFRRSGAPAGWSR